VRIWAAAQDHPFCKRFAAARRIGYMRMADEILEIADDPNLDVSEARLQIDARKWLLARCLPKVFGDRVVQEHSGRDGAPIEQVVRIERVLIDPATQVGS
jgi:hypothetical protein